MSYLPGSYFEAGNGILKRRFIRLLIVALAALAAIGICIGGKLPPFVTFYPTIVVVALLAGRWPGLMATTLATAASAFVLLPSRQNLAAIDISDAVALTLFFGGGVFISELAEHYRRNQRQIEDYQTERALQAQQRLEQVSQYHRLALEAAEFGAWDYRFQTAEVFWDERCQNIFGVGASDHCDYQAWLALIHPDDRPGVDEAVKRAIAGADRGAYQRDFRVLWPDGSIHWIESHGRVSFEEQDGEPRAVRFIGVSKDFTARKQADEALRSSQAKLHGIISSAMDAVISVDEQLHIVVFNRAAETVFLCPASEALGSALDRFIPKTLREAHRDHVRRNESEGFTKRSTDSPAILTGRRADGEEFPMEATISLAQADGEKIYTVILRDITERRQAEEVLRKQAELIDLAHNTIMVRNFDGAIRFWNLGAEELYGYTKNQAIGRIAHELLRTVFPKPLAEIEADILRQDRWEGELIHTASDGTRIVVSSRWALQRDSSGQPRGVMEINNDISERKQAEQALRTSEQRWATTLQSIGDAVISTDVEGNIEFMNEVAERLTGWPLSQAKGKNLSVIFRILQEVTRIIPESPVSKVLRSGKVVGLADHTLLIARDGAEIPIQDSAAPIRERNGPIEGVVVVFQDVIEQRKAEKALRISDRLATTGRLAATIAHEIHNPLDTISNLLYLISQGTHEDTTRDYASTASRELLRVTQMTQRMLAFQREAAKPVPVKISETLRSVTDLYERKIKSSGIQLKEEIDFDGSILALPGELRQMFANLIGNAVEAVAPRHGVIRVRAYASQDWRRQRAGLRVVVADDGPGIPSAARARIFEPFFTTKGESGTGLGLWIASEILRKYDGTLRLRTTTRPHASGTCFSVFLPFQTAAGGAEAAATPHTLDNHA